MIVLKILLYILLVVAGIVLLVLITPAGGELSYIDGKFRFRVKLWIINIMDSEGGGLYNWWKKRKAGKKNRPEKPKKPKPVKEKKNKKKKQREKYEWEKELDDIPVNDPETDAIAAETSCDTVSDTAPAASKKIESSEKTDVSPKNEDTKASSADEIDEDIEEDDDDDKEKSSVSDKIEKIVGLWESAQRPVLKIFKGFRFSDLYIDFVIADDDAYKCALNYGKYSTAVFNGLAFFSELFTVRLKTVDVRPQFGVSKGRWDVSGKLSVRLGTMVIAGAWLLITYLFRTFIPEKIRKIKMKKSAARQK